VELFLAVLFVGYRKSLIYEMFVGAKKSIFVNPVRNEQCCAVPQKCCKIAVQLICGRFAAFHKPFCSQSKVAAGCKNTPQPFKVLDIILQLSGSPRIAVK